MRCLAMAEALAARGIAPVFASVALTTALRDRIGRSGAVDRLLEAPPRVAADGPGSRADAAWTADLVQELDAPLLLIDGLDFGPAYFDRVAKAGARLAAFDDLARGPRLPVHLVINPSPAADPTRYADLAPAARHLLGPRYLPLRTEFVTAAATGVVPLAARRRVLLSFGGSDVLGLTLPVLERLVTALPAAVGIDVVVGGSHPGKAEIAAQARVWHPRVVVHVDTDRIAALMTTAGLAVSAAGGTAGELAAMQVPTILVVTADNQRPGAWAARQAGLADGIDAEAGEGGPAEIAGLAARRWQDLPGRQARADRLHGVVDVHGASRIADALCDLATMVAA